MVAVIMAIFWIPLAMGSYISTISISSQDGFAIHHTAMHPAIAGLLFVYTMLTGYAIYRSTSD